MEHPGYTYRVRAGSAFTLVELLVVIGIIAVLLAIFLPVLRKVRESANSATCMTNLRAIGQAMLFHAQEHRGAIAGSPLTTGRHLWIDTGTGLNLAEGVSNSKTPPPCVDIYDFMGPLCQAMDIALPETNSTVERFAAYRQLRQFSCPSNVGVIATKFSGPAGIKEGQMLSYCTATGFLLPPFRGSAYSGRVAQPGTPYWTVPENYGPYLGRIGNAADKIYAADSGRWSRYNSGPTFTLQVDADHNSTPFSDFGAFWGISKSYDRSVPNGLNKPAIDARVYGFRHGRRSQNGRTGEYRLNAVFFDGHVQTMDDMTAANPALWLPRGSVIKNPAAKVVSGPLVWPDVARRYIQEMPYVAP
jgi:prepilin-type N-terminal cleavage/methylation domain-containing protein/prepilin-type processing-associated H-X9-DG protein